jgi:hypothetical protein
MSSRHARNWIFAAATALSLACLFGLKFNASTTAEPRTLIGALAELSSSNELGHAGALETILWLLLDGVMLLTALLPPVLWLELTLARRPLSRRMRVLLIVQGIVGFAGVALTVLWMSLTMSYFGFGGDTDPAAPGFGVIVVSEIVYSIVSVLLGTFSRHLVRK